ncbi:UDP-glycosyltransferase 90A1-like [Benincasa hispida]|uniref:UDP-glycosyltransferase 90A1-like n=1 Tax=Benincasa hispida TaxID=102211 RepID=UPI001901D7B0|nr:UDP-glycosyltransferase 90A1-like [Benincasa hispida]
MDSDSQSSHHIVFFPFMAKGHTIPLLHLLRLLRRRFPHLYLTIFTTAAYRPFISQFLSDSGTDSISIVDLSFPQNVPGLPAGVESTDTLPSLSLHTEFCAATELMQPEFEERLRSLPVPVTFLISDMFFWWTLESASKLGILRINFSGMSNYSAAVTSSVVKNRVLAGAQSVDELVTVTDFPWVKITRGDFDPVFWPEAYLTSGHFQFQFIMKSVHAATNSYGFIVNSFYELEPMFFDYMRNSKKTWNIGPLCLDQFCSNSVRNRESTQKLQMQGWWEWLEGKLKQGEGVLYVAFGSQSEISCKQMKEIEIGLEESGVNFLWAKREEINEMEDKGFEERVKGRGIIVREWVNQWEVLKHEAVKGFLSHCGWNSVVESLSCGVPILTYPLMAEQSLNARMVVDELTAGMRAVEGTSSMKGAVKGKDLKRFVRELMEGEKGKEVRKKAMEISEMAKKAMAENGSSWKNLELLVMEMCNKSPLLPHTDLPSFKGHGANYA